MAETRIEAAAPADSAQIFALLERSGLPLAGLDGHLGTAIVGRQDGRVVASAALEIYADGALLRSVAVDADCQGNGVGQRITSAAIDLAARWEVPALFLLTTTAEGFFSRFGFTPIDRTEVPDGVLQSVEFRTACPASAVVMRKGLNTK